MIQHDLLSHFAAVSWRCCRVLASGVPICQLRLGPRPKARVSYLFVSFDPRQTFVAMSSAAAERTRLLVQFFFCSPEAAPGFADSTQPPTKQEVFCVGQRAFGYS